MNFTGDNAITSELRNKKISFIVLSWNSAKYLKRCFDSIITKCEKEGLSQEIIAIDNGSVDGSVSVLESYHRTDPHAFKKILLDKNMGTSYSRNLGLGKVAGKYVCILDSDVEISGGSLSEILKILETDLDIGIVSPRLLFPDGRIQNSVKKFPAFWQKVAKIPNIMFGLSLPNFDFYEHFPFQSPTSVDTAISACWIFRRDLLEIVGLFDEKIFYAPEDLDFCLRVRKTGKKIIYYPHLAVIHHTQQISHKNAFSRLSFIHFCGLIYYFRKHGGWLSTKKIARQTDNQ